MGTKIKGLLKGLRYISQIFEEEKEAEMQIGNPTDVKHVAHIGWDGPSASVDNAPSWMKEYKAATGGFQSAPLGEPGASKENPEVKWVSEDSKKGSRELPESPKSSRRHTSLEGANDSPKKKDGSTRSRQRRNHSKDSSDNVKSNRQNHKGESTSRNLPDIPKKSRRKKSKESINVGSSRSQSKASYLGPDAESVVPTIKQ
ncbi:Hypothetical predicted protein [Olea europaea subsp. europaea]|uniref:CRIB domain-containing protein n=2 Tax=Olea europaea subsp. europaea TaxID=158383 RepID=A0A8S0P8B4_OLEEU|nr:Hypothetical predicted protein [Olea europaea subsp. europaea]